MNKNQTQEAGTDYLKKLAEAQLHIREAEALDGGTGNFAELIAEAKAERRALKAERAEKRAARAQMEKTYYVSFEGGTFAYVQATSQEDAEEAALELPNTETILEVLDTRPRDPEWPPVELEDTLANREADRRQRDEAARGLRGVQEEIRQENRRQEKRLEREEKTYAGDPAAEGIAAAKRDEAARAFAAGQEEVRQENRRQEKRRERELERELDERAKDAWNANRTLSLSELRDVLFELVQAESQNGNEWVSKDMVHIAKEVKYGKIVSTAGITGAKMVTENGARHIILTTTN